jgi:cytochrome P450
MSEGGRRDLPSASFAESVRFTLSAMVPNLVQGLFRRRPRAVAAANKVDVDRRAVSTIGAIRRRHGSGPVWVRAGGDRMLLALDTEDVRRVLEGSPHPFAPDPDAKRRGMSAFQPDALTISRGDLWRNRRRFAESVLDTGEPLHRHADRFLEVVNEEVDSLLGELGAPAAKLDYDGLNRAGWRITRRIVLGDAARDDQRLTELLWELMDQANKLPKSASERLQPYLDRLGSYVSAAQPGSLVGLIEEAPSDAGTRVERQVTHWLFANGDTLFANLIRALALIASHRRQAEAVDAELEAATGRGRPEDPAVVSRLPYLAASIQEAMRLWPTTPILSRETLEEVDWDGAKVPAGTQILISNTFNHRDPGRAGGDRFEPEAWTEGERAADWSLNHFSHGPQGCPGAGLALFTGTAVAASILAQRRPRLLEPTLDPGKPLPHMLDFFRIRLELEPRG